MGVRPLHHAVVPEMEHLGRQPSASPPVVEGDAVDADEGRDQFEMQIRDQVQRLGYGAAAGKKSSRTGENTSTATDSSTISAQ
jgi:hypothetical protein